MWWTFLQHKVSRKTLISVDCLCVLQVKLVLVCGYLEWCNTSGRSHTSGAAVLLTHACVTWPVTDILLSVSLNWGTAGRGPTVVAVSVVPEGSFVETQPVRRVQSQHAVLRLCSISKFFDYIKLSCGLAAYCAWHMVPRLAGTDRTTHSVQAGPS